MLIFLGIATLVVILIAIGALKLTMREEPSGCFLALGSLLGLAALVVTVLLW
jgi:hypothetical protein